MGAGTGGDPVEVGARADGPQQLHEPGPVVEQEAADGGGHAAGAPEVLVELVRVVDKPAGPRRVGAVNDGWAAFRSVTACLASAISMLAPHSPRPPPGTGTAVIAPSTRRFRRADALVPTAYALLTSAARPFTASPRPSLECVSPDAMSSGTRAGM
jgi:hypothetical protein